MSPTRGTRRPRASQARGTYVDRSGRRRKLPLVPAITHEQRHWDAGRVVAGVDEVGRGAWAGPVTCAAVVLPTDRRIYKLRDSKLLTPEARELLDSRIRAHAVVGIGHAFHDEIDRVGMTLALRRAARRAVDSLGLRVDEILLDGNFDFLADHPARVTTLVKGDALSASIAAASIVAKVARDGWMVAAAEQHPGYDFADNKGYPAPTHMAALDDIGPCDLHRHSWEPIVRAVQPRLFD
ncbi:ribonuclease HII [Salsipaludibacter albus]|uniref:ribonuclease HII n=1 Tax=Salsipaludibacter albus TaxID=2849650 RepID=UPI001EE489C4|nr:ribonuclease HII [Salsipaludibacter albus]